MPRSVGLDTPPSNRLSGVSGGRFGAMGSSRPTDACGAMGSSRPTDACGAPRTSRPTALSLFFTTENTEGSGRNGMSQPYRAAPRNTWPIVRFLAHSRSGASSRLSFSSGEKPESATLRAKECLRNRTTGFYYGKRGNQRKDTEFRSHSSNRGAADLDFFADGNEPHLNTHEGEWRKRRIIGRIRRTVGWSVLFASADFRAFRSKKRLTGGRTDKRLQDIETNYKKGTTE